MEKEKLISFKQRYQTLLQQCQRFQTQCKELSEEEMKEITGGLFSPGEDIKSIIIGPVIIRHGSWGGRFYYVV